MDTGIHPAKRGSRAWILVACLAPLPLITALAIDGNATVVLVMSVLTGMSMVIASLVWAIQRSRAQRSVYEKHLAGWAAERAVVQERLRIARDLHDLSSHGLGIITVRAAATGYLTGPNADADRRQALLDIERMGRAATTELRRMLTLLRSPNGESAPLGPADSLSDLPAILGDAERHGILVQLTTENLGEEQDDYGGIGRGVQLTICVVVREALANIVRHAGPTTARISLIREGEKVAIVVDDDGPNPGWQAEAGAGHGLTGLRERLAAHHGSLAAFSTAPGFRLRATIPVESNA